MSTNSIRESLNARPTFTRQVSDNSQIELMRHQSRPSLTRSVSGSGSHILPQDVFDPVPLPGSDPLRPSVRERLAERLRLPAAQLPRPVRSLVSQTVDIIAVHWRDLSVASALTGLVSWAIWATVKIKQQGDIPYCVFDDGQEP